MKEIALEESKQIMTKTLESIDKCCRENNLKYSLCWGTMIGAIRHHGFIPWDDDIDLMMPRNDYNKFLQVYNNPNYSLYNPRIIKNCIQPLTKVYDNKTCVYFNNHHKSIFGLWISIFPYDNAPDENLKLWEWKRTVWMNLYHFKTVRFFNTETFLRKFVKVILKIPTLPLSSFWINSKIEKCLTAYNYQKTKNICIWPADSFSEFDYYPSEMMEECIDIDFEGVNCRIIKRYDEFLRKKYGDYMTFPPESERIPKHDYRAYYLE